MFPPSISEDACLTEALIVEWDDLINNFNDTVDTTAAIARIQNAIHLAYGTEAGIGILAVRGVPGFVQAKDEFLPMAHTLATQLPESYLETKLTDADSLYNAGWSFGKEQLGKNKLPDTSKGSFYYNPVTDLPGTEEDRTKYPLSYPCNIWPSDEYIPNFKASATKIGVILKDVAVILAKHLDTYVASKLPSSVPNNVTSLHENLKNTDKVKARLLYYFPLSSPKNAAFDATINEHQNAEDSWIGWHNDSGFLTALAGDIYVNHNTGDRIFDGIDPNSGLYVLDRTVAAASTPRVLKVTIPYDCCAIQLGECTQIVTGGILVATPHCVRGCNPRIYPTLARISLPCFVDTYPTFPLTIPNGMTRAQVLVADAFSHNKVPPLALRWKSCREATQEFDSTTIYSTPMTFGDFLQETFRMYYEWGSESKNE